MKICKVCLKEKPLDDFYKLSKSRANHGDGHDTRCKECVKAYARSEKVRAKARLRDIKRNKTPQRKEAYKKWAQSEKGKETLKRNQRSYYRTDYGKEQNKTRCQLFRKTSRYKDAIERYRSKYPEKRMAQIILSNAIQSGKISRPNECSICHKTCTPQGHHYDYSLPLSVIWMCKQCHSDLHWGIK